ncbi:hypothetical protein HBB16_00505 [Pseudonocardia sp. MCCB 268]|nr:hypothetical protein [Pseudonocardia cytotoxica]
MAVHVRRDGPLRPGRGAPEWSRLSGGARGIDATAGKDVLIWRCSRRTKGSAIELLRAALEPTRGAVRGRRRH